MDTTHLRYSYKQTCVVTLTVGQVEGHDEWHLPTYDPQNQQKYHYKLHSLDLYFWTQPDALQFVNGIRRVLPPAQCEVLDEPGPPPPRQQVQPDADVSAVVQKLEKAAIAGNGGGSGGQDFAPPPISAVSGTTGPSPPQTFVPMAYNPAAPAAPEQIRPREKTPPPEDGDVNPLHQTLAYDATTPFSPGLVPSALGPMSPGLPPPQFQSPPGAPAFPGPPKAPPVSSPGIPPQGFGSLGASAVAQPVASPPPHQHPGLARAATMPAQGLPSPGLASPGFSSPGVASPGVASPYGANFPNRHPQNTPTPPHVASPSAPPPPPGGYSPYSYSGSQSIGGMDYSIHQQVYRPTENEAAVQYKPKQETRGKLEENAGRLERGMTGMLKKFEKKFG